MLSAFTDLQQIILAGSAVSKPWQSDESGGKKQLKRPALAHWDASRFQSRRHLPGEESGPHAKVKEAGNDLLQTCQQFKGTIRKSGNHHERFSDNRTLHG